MIEKAGESLRQGCFAVEEMLLDRLEYHDECKFPEVINFQRNSIQDKYHLCTAMIVSNLAAIFWVPVNCFKPMIPNIVCTVKSTMELKNSSQNAVQQICSEEQTRFNNRCFQFWQILYVNDSLQFYNNICHNSLQKARITVFDNDTDKLFQLLFQATNVKKLYFISQHNYWETNKITVLQTFGIVKKPVSESIIANGQYFLSCSMHLRNRSTEMLSLFLCDNQQYISASFVFDGANDCADQEISSDEAGSTFLDSPSEHCLDSPLFYQSKAKTCQSFVLSTCEIRNVNLRRRYRGEFSKHKLHFQETQIPCSNSSTVYQFADVCIYQVDAAQKLIPCPDGSHVQECSNFQCNAKFKCHGYYCIPWHYVCDGLWDCPSGLDETSQQCPEKVVCEHMFKCRQSHTCVSMWDVCNNKEDCPRHDDELLCQLHKTKCVTGCQCLNLAIKCKNTTSLNGQLTRLPHIAYHIVLCDLTHINGLHKFVLIMNLTSNCIQNICLRDVTGNHIVKFDISNNQVMQLKRNCFLNLTKIRLLSFKSNRIFSVESGTFTNISSPFSLNLENNNISSLIGNIFTNVQNIIVLKIMHNPFLLFDAEIFIKATVNLVITDQYQICAVTPVSVRCNKDKPWCVQVQILENFPLEITTILLFAFAFIINVLLIIIVSRTSICKAKNKPFNLLLGNLSVCNILGSTHLAIVWSAHKYFGNSYIFSDEVWRASLPCVCAFVAILTFCILEPHIHLVVAVSRFSVAKYPLQSKFKSCKFVMKSVAKIEVVSCALAVGETCSVSLGSTIPNSLCLPFTDPTKLLFQMYFMCSVVFLIHFYALVCIITLSAKMAAVVKSSGIQSGTMRTLGKKAAFQLCLVTLVNGISWLGLSMISICLLFLKQYPLDLISSVPVILFIDAVLNPFVYLVLHASR